MCKISSVKSDQFFIRGDEFFSPTNNFVTDKVIINTTYKTILPNAKTALQHTGIQYTVTILGNQGRYLS